MAWDNIAKQGAAKGITFAASSGDDGAFQCGGLGVSAPASSPHFVAVGGTSIGAPLVAGIYGLAGNGARTGHRRLYRHASSFFDITRGNNSFFEPAAAACGRDYLCVAKRGYDAPSGLGSPRGTRAF